AQGGKRVSGRQLPPGDYVVGSESSFSQFGGQLIKPVLRWTEPADGSGASGWDCDNSPGLRKNLEQFGRFIPAAIMGEDSRCPLDYSSRASDVDKIFYGGGAVWYSGSDGGCQNFHGQRCRSTGNLVGDGDIFVASAHGFWDAQRRRRLSREEILTNFRFMVKVWVPPQFRRNPSESYEFRAYEIEDVEFGTHDEFRNPEKDYALVKLKKVVGAEVGRPDDRGIDIPSTVVSVPKDKQVVPLPFKRFDRKKVPNVVMTAGFQGDKKWVMQKNCKPFQLYDPPNASHPLAAHPGLLAHDGDTNGIASGSALTLLVDGKPHFAAVHIGSEPEGGALEGGFDINTRYNYAVDGQSFYDHFMEFRRRFGRN
ncbi:MAG: hypothetical protein KDD43_15745, partial [Bdellovibrionales bacterium]|nr:hypothetical protein [Bdellovibrionales bacterium]